MQPLRQNILLVAEVSFAGCFGLLKTDAKDTAYHTHDRLLLKTLNNLVAGTS